MTKNKMDDVLQDTEEILDSLNSLRQIIENRREEENIFSQLKEQDNRERAKFVAHIQFLAANVWRPMQSAKVCVCGSDTHYPVEFISPEKKLLDVMCPNAWYTWQAYIAFQAERLTTFIKENPKDFFMEIFKQ